MDEVLMTVNGKKMLDLELENLVRVERDKIIQAIAEARAHGDLKENADYSAAKERQSIIEGRILELQSKINRARVIDVTKTKNQRIVFGATVQLLDSEKNISVTYQIVGEDEADLKNGKISYLSPLGKAMIGREEGDTVTVKAPKGDIEYEVENVQYK
ncbi:MAG: transcription elongation factor GreA [Bacteriovoracaceae bacterium]